MHQLTRRMEQELRVRGYAPRTLQSYAPVIEKFVASRGDSLTTPTVDEAKAFLVTLSERPGISWSTFNVYSCALRFLFSKVLRAKGRIEDIPFQRRRRHLPVVLSEGEIERILAKVERLKYRAMVMTAYAGGLRSSEVCSLLISDIDSQRMRIRVRQGKGRKDRYTLLGEKLLGVLRTYWLKERPRHWLFPGEIKGGSEHADARTLQKVFKRARLAAGLVKPATLHTLRHSFATHLLESGVDVAYIKELIGHKSIGTTLIYTKVRLSASLAPRSPLDRLRVS